MDIRGFERRQREQNYRVKIQTRKNYREEQQKMVTTIMLQRFCLYYVDWKGSATLWGWDYSTSRKLDRTRVKIIIIIIFVQLVFWELFTSALHGFNLAPVKCYSSPGPLGTSHNWYLNDFMWQKDELKDHKMTTLFPNCWLVHCEIVIRPKNKGMKNQ